MRCRCWYPLLFNSRGNLSASYSNLLVNLKVHSRGNGCHSSGHPHNAHLTTISLIPPSTPTAPFLIVSFPTFCTPKNALSLCLFFLNNDLPKFCLRWPLQRKQLVQKYIALVRQGVNDTISVDFTH